MRLVFSGCSILFCCGFSLLFFLGVFFFLYFVDSFQFEKRLTQKFVVRLFRFFIFIFVAALKIKSIAFWLEFCYIYILYSIYICICTL